MAEQDRFEEDLRSLAEFGEVHAGHGWSPDHVRQAGARRRQRRVIGIAAATIAAITLGGGVVFSSTMKGGIDQPAPVQTPVASPTATPATAQPTDQPTSTSRVITTANLIRTSDIPTQVSEQQVLVTDPGLGRSVAKSTVCVPDGLDQLEAVQVLSRNFRIKVPGEPTSTAAPGDELAQQPSFYTQALQFSDDATAEAAYAIYRSWLKGCASLIKGRGYTPLGQGNDTWYPVKTAAGSEGGFTEIVYRAPGQSQDYGWFEAVGLTRVGDRVMVTISLLVGPDKIVTFEQFPKKGLPDPHEQYALVVAAAERLGA